MRLLKVAGYTVVRLLGNLFKSTESEEKLSEKIWLYVVSQNNYDSLKFITTSLPDAVLVAGQSKEIGKYNTDVARISLKSKILYYNKFIPLLLQFLWAKKHYTLRFFDILYDAVGFYEVYTRKLRKYRPQCIVFANDHTPDARAMLLAAKAVGIKTIYIQHASVSNIFPPLQFDLNLLEGQDSLEKYRSCGPITGKIKLIGMPKADEFTRFRNTQKEIKVIGIGANLMDLTEEIQSLIVSISHHFPEISILLRPHPRDKRDFSLILNVSNNVSLSNGSEVPTFEYLQQIDVLISGNSGIHLEAVLLNVWSIYFNFNHKENLHDYYGYVAKGLSDEAASVDELISMLQNQLNSKPDVYQRAACFNATVGTDWDGKSSELAINELKSFIA